jgi:alpha-glucoside transport system permease protein
MIQTKQKTDYGLDFKSPPVTFGLLIATLLFLVLGFIFLRDGEEWFTTTIPALRGTIIPQLIVAIFAIFWGVVGIATFFFTANSLVELLPEKWTRLLQPYVFVGPALLLLGCYLAIPTLLSLWASLFNTSDEFIGIGNYLRVFTERINVQAWGNNLLWMVVGTALVVLLGLLIAILADRSKFERVAKSLIFMPMAISMVGAGVIWKFVYDGNPEIGLLNAVVTSAGGEAQSWLTTNQPWNNLFLIITMVWLQTGYTMVLISAAIKSIPDDWLEAARVDGANEVRIFMSIILPNIAGTLLTSITTVVIFTLKIFDIVRVMTGGNYGTDVIGVRFYNERFSNGDEGMASAIAIVLLIAVIPVMIYNLREFSKRDTF